MEVYLIILVTALLTGLLLDKDSKRYWLWAIVGSTTISLLIGLRNNVGIDWLHFHQLYQWITFGQDVDIEAGFKYLSLFFGKVLNLGSWTIFTVMAFCFIFPFYVISSKYRDKAYILITIFLLLNLTNSLTVARQYAAMGLFVWAFKYLSGGDTKKYLIMSLCAVAFHTTVILYVVAFYFLYKCNFFLHRCFKLYAALLVLSILFSYQIESLFSWVYENFVVIGVYLGRSEYVDNAQVWENQLLGVENERTVVSYWMNCLSNGLLIYYGDKLLKGAQNKNLYFLYHITVISNILLPICLSQELLKRMIWYMTIFTPIVFALIYKQFFFKNKKINLGSCLLLLNLLYMLYSYLMQGEAMNYKFL